MERRLPVGIDQGGLKGTGVRNFFASIFRMWRIKSVLIGLKKAHSRLWETKVFICFYPDHPVNRCKNPPP